MSAFFVASRALHYASALLLFGELLFVFILARRWYDRHRAAADRCDFRLRLAAVAALGIAASLVSAVTWLIAEASVMSGLPIGEVLNPGTLAPVLTTGFGRVWIGRLGLLAALCVALLAMRQPASDRLRSRLIVSAIVLAATYLATLALAGHAAGGPQQDRLVLIVSDAMHLLAAGAWVGALPGLVYFLKSAEPLGDAADVTRRFSTLAAGSVGVLVASGLINAWYLVGDVPALIGTDYGRLLLSKLALFAAMLVLAMVNRWYLMPQLVANDRGALRWLRRNAIFETAAGFAVVTIVGALGITVPGAHETPVWPFAYTLSWRPAEQTVWIGAALGAAAVIGCAGAGAVLGGLRSHQPRYWLAGLAGTAAAGLTWTWLLAVPAHPTTYAPSPVRYTTSAIARGAAVYARRCSECHGGTERGEARAALARPAGSLGRIDYEAFRYPGDLFWSIAHGIPGTAMPGFTPRVGDDDIWALTQFLRARSESRLAMALTERVDPWRPIVAPEFTFEVAGKPQQSLRRQTGSQQARGAVVVVLYTLPASRQRLDRLAADASAFTQAGARVIALPFDASSPPPSPELKYQGGAMLASAGPDVAATYAMFAHPRSADMDFPAPRHVEFLIDRQGYLRARWLGVPDPAESRTVDILGQIEVLNREPPGGPAEGRGH